MKLYKDGLERDVIRSKIAEYKRAGWSEQPAGEVKAVEDVVRLKPPVKTKATVKVLDEATDKGDE